MRLSYLLNDNIYDEKNNVLIFMRMFFLSFYLYIFVKIPISRFDLFVFHLNHLFSMF